MIVATAGHVDHGKTSLVKALTGVDTDTLAEEKTRGLSINLGYAYVPSDHQETLGFIDVPGHQRFINNMIAGVSGIDRALLVVAADDGPMPQTLEHLDVLALLGIGQLDLVITKVDRCEKARAEQVADQTQALVTQRLGTRADVFYVSSVTGDGIEALRQHLKKAVPRRHTGIDQQGFRLSIDRRFHVKGAGIVVTGTASAGQVALGETLTLLPQGAQVRVRDLRANDQVTDRAQTGQRVALCVTGKVQLEDIERGHCLMDPTLACPSQRVDAEVSILAHSPHGLKHLTPVKVYIGAQRLSARIALIDHAGSTLQPGNKSLVQLIFDSSVSTFTGERFLIR
ncbi:MAG: selenocysteine-specific translation elongation factor, partial [Halieaceae bacterium]|nr:selenocysteine-specific translation elongation factor [Halieaceae bacterium]